MLWKFFCLFGQSSSTNLTPNFLFCFFSLLFKGKLFFTNIIKVLFPQDLQQVDKVLMAFLIEYIIDVTTFL